MSRRHLIILPALFAGAGCVMIPSYEQPAAPVTQAYPGVAQTNQGFAADIAWKDVFHEEQLTALIGLALTNSRVLRVAVLNVERNQAQYRIAKAESYPEVAGTGGLLRQHSAGTTENQWSANVGLTSYELDLFGRVRSLNEQALETYLASVEAQRAVQLSLVAEVASQYFALRLAEDQLALARLTLASVAEAHKINRAAFDTGTSSALDLRTSEGLVQSATISVTSYERQVALAENYLVLLIGHGLPADLPARQKFVVDQAVSVVPAGLPSELIQRRPDILEAECALKAANANIGAARAAFFPTLSLTASIGTSSAELQQLFGAGSGIWSFAPQITMPIFAGGRLRAELSLAQISTRMEVAKYEQTIQTAFREVSDALVSGASYATQADQQARLVVIQQARLDLATARYRQGEDGYLNVLSAQQDLYNAQRSLIDLQYSKTINRISLYKALGGGWK